MGALRQAYYNLFSRIYDHIIRLHSRDRQGTLRGFITDRTRATEGDTVLDICTGTGAVDMVDGTPLLDIKPYVPLFDTATDVRIGWFSDRAGGVFEARSDRRFRK